MLRTPKSLAALFRSGSTTKAFRLPVRSESRPVSGDATMTTTDWASVVSSLLVG